MNRPKLTIGIIAAGRAKCLKKCIASLKTCLTHDYRLLVIDSIPNSRSRNTVRSVDNASYIALDEPVGPSKARGIISEHIREGYVLFLDSDNTVKRDSIEDMICFLEEGQTDIACGVWQEKNIKREIGQLFVPVFQGQEKGIMKKFLFKEDIVSDEVTALKVDGGMSTMMMSSDVFNVIEFDPQYSFYYDMFDFFMQCKFHDLEVKVLLNAVFGHHPQPYPEDTKRQTGSRKLDKKRFETKWGLRQMGQTAQIATNNSFFERLQRSLRNRISQLLTGRN